MRKNLHTTKVRKTTISKMELFINLKKITTCTKYINTLRKEAGAKEKTALD
jgi:hypothetical protein